MWNSWKTLKILKVVLKLYKIKCLENLSFDVFKSQVDIYKFLRIESLSMLMNKIDTKMKLIVQSYKEKNIFLKCTFSHTHTHTHTKFSTHSRLLK